MLHNKSNIFRYRKLQRYIISTKHIYLIMKKLWLMVFDLPTPSLQIRVAIFKLCAKNVACLCSPVSFSNPTIGEFSFDSV